ncbi:MAG TPA: DinB family protein [Pyrinomonadaceae bacterium]|nr:DinB family protein [Pyrinomonadaceae bacterium]HMP66218.1 DinB family protein [Pyrinomonadaceae bacterium]
MKQLLSFGFVIVFAALSYAQNPPGKITFTEKDREFALKYLNETKDEYVKQLTGISDAQLNFRAAEGRWTIAEIAEHITVVETALFGMCTAPDAAKTFECDDLPRIPDTALILAITNRSQKFTAPEQVRPNGRWKTREDLIASFEKARAITIDHIKNNKADLRATFIQSPMGMVDSFQGILFLTGHSDRHLDQLREVKDDPKYPKK